MKVKLKITSLICFLIIGSCVGCIGQESTGNSSKTPNDSIDASIIEDVGNLSINFSTIPVLPPYN
ncbi:MULTISPECIES: hypothetical protein [unclassified Methanosarcina]|uniref:hypothetical protein n=1 Tax=unclassified Methanosarcina TaxID=2644672 RepID=UPI001F2A4B5F|nr:MULTISPECIES: hypothetical protein [unclassified Methanosarcina]